MHFRVRADDCWSARVALRRHAPTASAYASGELDGRAVLIAAVSPSDGTLYALVIDANKPESYVRRDTTTFCARPEELAETVAKAHANGRPRSLLCSIDRSQCRAAARIPFRTTDMMREPNHRSDPHHPKPVLDYWQGRCFQKTA